MDFLGRRQPFVPKRVQLANGITEGTAPIAFTKETKMGAS
jgi:hypothetical protein